MRIVCLVVLCFFVHFVCGSQKGAALGGASAAQKVKPYVVVYPSPQAGLFAACHLLLGFLHRYDKGIWPMAGLKMDCGQEGLYYDPLHGPNWWSYYFEPVEVGKAEEGGLVRYSKRREHETIWQQMHLITRQEGHRLIQKYIKVKQPILDEANHFADQHFKGYYVLGVHYRGTDKRLEAPRIPYQNILAVVESRIGRLSNRAYRIYVATDEENFVSAMRERFGDKIIVTEAMRSTDGKSVHHAGLEPFDRGREAVVDALLLASCNELIRTSSNLSGWSALYNPTLPTVVVKTE